MQTEGVSKGHTNKYQFYDLVLETPTHPIQPLEASLMKSLELKELKKSSGITFEGNYSTDGLSPEERIRKVFGGRIKGETRELSSRLNRGEPRTIAGVLVPDKPPEPDNCCMSGCINCVWELFNEDVKEWNAKRKEAALKLKERGGVWPADFHPPVKYLSEENLPGNVKKVETQPKEEETWGNVPVTIRVFAEMERKMKLKKKAKV